jgi:hypothetical protein
MRLEGFRLGRSGRDQFKQFLDSSIGTTVGCLDLGGSLGAVCGATAKETVNQRSADALVKEREYEGHAGSFFGQSVAVARASALKEAVSLQLAQVITELGDGVILFGERVGFRDRAVDVSTAASP